MNAPFKPDLAKSKLDTDSTPVIEDVLATACVSITKLKANPAAVVAEAKLRQVAILSRNRPVAYVIAPHVWAYLCDLVEDKILADEAEEALAEMERSGEKPVRVTIDELLA